jgi:hypothetical protein
LTTKFKNYKINVSKDIGYLNRGIDNINKSIREVTLTKYNKTGKEERE